MGLLQAERPYQGKIKRILRHMLKPEQPGTSKHKEQKEHERKKLRKPLLFFVFASFQGFLVFPRSIRILFGVFFVPGFIVFLFIGFMARTHYPVR